MLKKLADQLNSIIVDTPREEVGNYAYSKEDRQNIYNAVNEKVFDAFLRGYSEELDNLINSNKTE